MNNIFTQDEEKSIWKNKQFLLLWGGNSFANLFFYVFTYSIPIIIYQYTSSSFAMSMMRVIEVLPTLFLGIIIGVFVDRWDRKKVLIYSTIIQILILILLIITINIKFELWIIYLLGFILYTAGFTFGNAYHAILPIMVPKSQLVMANSSISFINNLISIVGPSLAGIITILFSLKYNLIVTIIGFFILLLFIFMMKIPYLKDEDKRGNTRFIEEIKDGWNQLVGNEILFVMTVMIFITNISNGLTGAVIIFHSLDTFEVNNTLLGLIISSTGVGAIIASLTANKSRKWGARGRLFLILIGLSSLGQIILYASQDWYWISIGLIIIGFSLILINIHYASLRQETTPNHLLGRVVGTSSMIMKLATPISFLLGGLLADLFAVRYVFFISSLILILYILYGIKKKMYLLN